MKKIGLPLDFDTRVMMMMSANAYSACSGPGLLYALAVTIPA